MIHEGELEREQAIVPPVQPEVNQDDLEDLPDLDEEEDEYEDDQENKEDPDNYEGED